MKIQKIFPLVVLLMLSTIAVQAEDPVWIEAPSVVKSWEPFEITLHIDDPTVHKLTDEVLAGFTGGTIQYREKSDPSEIMPYKIDIKGKDKIVLVASASYYEGGENIVQVEFTFNAPYEEVSKYVKDSYETRFTIVRKNITVAPAMVNVNYPEPPACEESINNEPFGAVRFSCHAEDKHEQFFSISGMGKIFTCFDRLESTVGCSFIDKSKVGTVEDNGQGKVISYEGTGNKVIQWKTEVYEGFRYKEDPDDDEEEYKYQTYFSGYYYSDDGLLAREGDMLKGMWLEKDDVASEAGTFKDEFNAFITSISSVRDGGGPDTKSVYSSILGEPVEEEFTLYGYLTDADQNPMPYMDMYVKIGKDVFPGRTDENGNYMIAIEGLKVKEGEEIEGSLNLNWSYTRDGKTIYQIIQFFDNRWKYYSLNHKVTLTQGENTELNWVLDNTPNTDLIANGGNYNTIRETSAIYWHMHEAVDFAYDIGAKIDHRLPVFVFVGQQIDSTLYSPRDGDILIDRSDMAYGNSNKPKNREYHEFGHHIMWTNYGGWTKGVQGQQNVNHDGFINPNTADSWDEGFAEFYALAVSAQNGQKNPDIYASFGSLENNYKPWHGKGYDEEFAVASLLWDIYDKNNEKGDNLNLRIEDIWSVIKERKGTTYDYYESFKSKFPSKAAELEEVFILHGFYADDTEGNHKRDSFEPFKDANNDEFFDEGEVFIDYGYTSVNDTLHYDKDMPVGYAANYERLDRKQAGRVPGAFLEIDADGPRYYRVSVSYGGGDLPDYSYGVERFGDTIYLHPLPDDVDAKITLEPISEEFSFEEPFEITNAELVRKVYASDGETFASHDFVTSKTGKGKDPIYLEGYEPKLTNDDGKDTLESPDIVWSSENDLKPLSGKKGSDSTGSGDEYSSVSSGGFFSAVFGIFKFLFILGVIGIAGYFGYTYLKKRK